VPTKEELLAFNAQLIADFRANGGVLTTGPMAGRGLLLLTSVGTRTGEPHTAPLAYQRDGDAYVIVGSNGGRPAQPAWLANIEKDATVTCEVGAETFTATAQVLSGTERRRVLDAFIEAIPAFGEYERTVTTREIPAVLLHRWA
jgi:deazaflavin-dependent oxidoreductase (nitroreductase family)